MSSVAEMTGLLEAIPPVRDRAQPDLFSISGFPHYEDVLSNWYRFFMDPNGTHGLGTLFLECLLELCNVQQGPQLSDRLIVSREHTTASGKAIDLLIHDGALGQRHVVAASNAIIIENKVYHWLANDLNDYWSSVRDQGCQKLGVLLSLLPMRVADTRFRNVTHRSLLDRVKTGCEGRNVTTQARVYLEDLNNNISNLTQDMHCNEDVSFFFDNAERIRDVMRLEAKARHFIAGQLVEVADKLQMQLSRWGDRYWYITMDRKDSVYYTILLDEMLDKGTALLILVELSDATPEQIAQLDQLCEHTPGTNGFLESRPYRKGKNWVQYMGIRLPILPEQRDQMADLAHTAIKQRLQPIYQHARNVMRDGQF